MDSHFDDLISADVADEEAETLRRTARLLEDSRPIPAPAFRGELRRRLLGSTTFEARPAKLRLLIATYAGLGSLLLAIAAWGVAGAGPLAA